MAGTTGLEPAASAVTGQRSNQLNYVPTRQINENAQLPVSMLLAPFALEHHVSLNATTSALAERPGNRLGLLRPHPERTTLKDDDCRISRNLTKTSIKT